LNISRSDLFWESFQTKHKNFYITHKLYEPKEFHFFLQLRWEGGGIKGHNLKNKKISVGDIISIENLFIAWQEFKKGKMRKKDVQEFAFDLEDNLFKLLKELKDKKYQHTNYSAFNISDPKPRKIHKAIVKDRILHHVIFRILYPLFDQHFIFDSYSSRKNKGTHKAVDRLEIFCRKLSRNNKINIFALKLDIKKFFASVDQEILLCLIKKKIEDKSILDLLEIIIRSFNSGLKDKGIPLGNVVSQLFANIYLNELDQFVKHNLKIKYYLRYCDDFIILGKDRKDLENLIKRINNFLQEKLKLNLHPDKIIIRKYGQGIDFLGYVVLPRCRVLRTKTKRRMLQKLSQKKMALDNNLISKECFEQSRQSYLGVLGHCSGWKIVKKLKTEIGLI